MKQTLILGLGSNDTAAPKALQQAIELIKEKFGCTAISCSAVFQNEAVGFESKRPFLNMVVSIQSALSPIEALDLTEEIERTMGRTQKSSNGYTSRVIDIDLIFFGKHITESKRLQIPHPHFHKRDFVLQPLMGLHPDFIDPKTQLSIKQHFSGLSTDRNLVEKKI